MWLKLPISADLGNLIVGDTHYFLEVLGYTKENIPLNTIWWGFDTLYPGETRVGSDIMHVL